jgi:Uma2 family endonuclease
MGMNSSPKGLYSAADYRITPDGPPWIQLIEGELVTDPSPSSDHQRVVPRLTVLLDGYVRLRRLGEVYVAPLDVYLSDHNVFQPEVFFISRARAAIVAADGVYGAPDLAIEILSPSSSRRDCGQKLRVYRRAEVKEYWVIDPLAKRVQIYDFRRDSGDSQPTRSENAFLASALFLDLEITAAYLFGQ